MELRVLKYFLVVAREENITKAAALLHVTQPTLSRQLMGLEEELGVKLFRRGKYHVALTDDGMLLRRRAQEIVELAEKTEQEFQRKEGELAGDISIGTGESNSMTDLSRKIAAFRGRNSPGAVPHLQRHRRCDSSGWRRVCWIWGMLIEPVDIAGTSSPACLSGIAGVSGWIKSTPWHSRRLSHRRI